MTKTVTISATRANGDPYAHHDVIVTLIAGSAGGVVGSTLRVESSTVRLDVNGAGSIVLATNDTGVESPTGSFYRFTVAGSSPTISRSIALTDDLPSTVSWTLAGIQVADPTDPQRDVSSDYVTVPVGTMPVVESVDPPATQSLTNLLASTDATIAAVGGNAATIAGDLATTQGDVAALQTDVTTLQTDVGTAQAAAEAAQAAAEAAQADLADVEIPYDAGPESGGKWAVVCSPGQYTTPDVGPFVDGFSCKARVMAIAPRSSATGSTISFLEFLTQIRQAPGAWGDDQDNKELALAVQYDSVGVFDEHCQTDTPAPVQAGEYMAGRVSWQPFYAPNDYVFADASFRLGLGEPIWLWQEHVFDDGAGQWRKTIWRRTDQAGSDFEDADGVYWRRIVEKVGTDGPGSIADAGMPWQIGTNPGLLAVESITVYDGATPRLHFDTADAQIDGTVASSLIPGQVWTPNGSPYIVDTTLAGLAALATGGGGAVDSVNGETGAVTLSAADVGADPAGTAAALVDDLSGVSNASTARTNLGLGGAAVLAVGTTAGTVAAGDDARLADARTPTSHNQAASTITSGTLDIARIPTGTTSTTVPLGNDARFSDARTPTAHTHTLANISDAGTLAGLNAVASANITDGTIVAGDLAASVSGRIPTTVVLGSDQASDTSATIANTTGLSFAVTSGTTYLIRGMLDVTGANAGDLRLSLTCPTGTVRLAVWGKNYASSATGADATYTATIVASGGIASDMATIAAQSSLVLFEGYFTASASGTFQMQHGQRVANATATTVKAGSYLTYHTT